MFERKCISRLGHYRPTNSEKPLSGGTRLPLRGLILQRRRTDFPRSPAPVKYAFGNDLPRFRSPSMRLTLSFTLGLALLAAPVLAAPPKSDKNEKPPVLTNDGWKGVSTDPLRSGEIDELVAKAQKEAKVTPSPRTTDE